MKKFGFAMMLGILGLALVGGGVFAAEVPLEGYALHSAPGGTMIATEDLLGSPVLLIFFTPNCPACEKELKSLDSQWRGFEEKWGVKVLPVAPGVLKDQASRLAEFVRQRWGV
ncbi:MAG TPA: redoxin domain-containing protein, partial [Synergistaceae bacterium]|nr:redoxin domain-containing protein [Synergistaceae bacterium]